MSFGYRDWCGRRVFHIYGLEAVVFYGFVFWLSSLSEVLGAGLWHGVSVKVDVWCGLIIGALEEGFEKWFFDDGCGCVVGGFIETDFWCYLCFHGRLWSRGCSV